MLFLALIETKCYWFCEEKRITSEQNIQVGAHNPLASWLRAAHYIMLIFPERWKLQQLQPFRANTTALH